MGLSNSSVLSEETEGYNILKVQDGSPAQLAGFESYFDFILAIGTSRLSQDNESMKTILKANIDKQVKVTLFSSRTNLCREVTVIPSTGWGGAGLLGVSIRFCSIRSARETVWHVLDVAPKSPAAEAGLVAQHDYIVGSDALLLESEDFFSLVETYDGRQLKLFVYNSLLNTSREVTLMPRSDWGGPGALGCGIGYGYLHRIPAYISQQTIAKIPDLPPPPYTPKEPTPEKSSPPPESNHPEVPGSIESGEQSVLPPMVTSVNLPGLPPLNVSVPSISIDTKTCAGVIEPEISDSLLSHPTNIPQAIVSQT